jgi:hypothetical protein
MPRKDKYFFSPQMASAVTKNPLACNILSQVKNDEEGREFYYDKRNIFVSNW